MRRLLCAGSICLSLAGCQSVRQEDLASWEGQPATKLDMHPVFITMKLIRTKTDDGTEIRNYLNAQDVTTCSSSGDIRPGGFMSSASYDQFMACSHSLPTCNNIFYIKNGRVLRYTPVGTGGAKCFTDDRARPDFSGPTNM